MYCKLNIQLVYLSQRSQQSQLQNKTAYTLFTFAKNNQRINNPRLLTLLISNRPVSNPKTTPRHTRERAMEIKIAINRVYTRPLKQEPPFTPIINCLIFVACQREKERDVVRQRKKEKGKKFYCELSQWVCRMKSLARDSTTTADTRNAGEGFDYRTDRPHPE